MIINTFVATTHKFSLAPFICNIQSKSTGALLRLWGWRQEECKISAKFGCWRRHEEEVGCGWNDLVPIWVVLQTPCVTWASPLWAHFLTPGFPYPFKIVTMSPMWRQFYFIAFQGQNPISKWDFKEEASKWGVKPRSPTSRTELWPIDHEVHPPLRLAIGLDHFIRPLLVLKNLECPAYREDAHEDD